MSADARNVTRDVGVTSPAADIAHVARFTQRLAFDGLPCAACDIDAAFDLWGRALVLVEVKLAGTPMPRGQELLLERLADASAVPCLVLHAEHETHDPHAIIPLARARVVRYRWGGRHAWVTSARVVSVERWLAHVVARFPKPGSCITPPERC